MGLYGPVLYDWARRDGLRDEDAADVVQEVYLALTRHIERFGRQPDGTFRGWLWTVLRSKVVDLVRRRRLRPEAQGGSDAYERLLQAETPADGSSAVDAPPPSWLMTRVVETIRPEFKESSWRAFQLLVIDEQSPADVAAALGLSLNAVYIARSRILTRLRDELGDSPIPVRSG